MIFKGYNYWLQGAFKAGEKRSERERERSKQIHTVVSHTHTKKNQW